VIIAGPNGAGKTIFAQEFLARDAGCADFVNADPLARGLSPFAPEKAAIQAGKIMLGQIAVKVARRESFAFETTLSGPNYSRHIPRWRKAGFHLTLIFLGLPAFGERIQLFGAVVGAGRLTWTTRWAVKGV